MPMIEYRYDPEKVNEGKAKMIGGLLERALRRSIEKVRPGHPGDYGVTTEGDPFRITFKQPDLRIHIFYHQEWEFTPDELKKLKEAIGPEIRTVVHSANAANIDTVVRFYARTGHAGIHIS